MKVTKLIILNSIETIMIFSKYNTVIHHSLSQRQSKRDKWIKKNY